MLGQKIRKKRLEKNMSLKELAEKTDLTASFLSQVERDLAEPSITSLRKIAEALEVPIFYFLLDNGDTSPVVKKNERKVLKFPESHLVYELLTPNLNGQMEMMMARLEEGGVSCDEPSSHPGEECIYVLQGKMEITVGDEVYRLEEGDSIYYYAAIPHKIVNVGDEELVFISAITPPRF